MTHVSQQSYKKHDIFCVLIGTVRNVLGELAVAQRRQTQRALGRSHLSVSLVYSRSPRTPRVDLDGDTHAHSVSRRVVCVFRASLVIKQTTFAKIFSLRPYGFPDQILRCDASAIARSAPRAALARSYSGWVRAAAGRGIPAEVSKQVRKVTLPRRLRRSLEPNNRRDGE